MANYIALASDTQVGQNRMKQVAAENSLHGSYILHCPVSWIVYILLHMKIRMMLPL